MMYYKIYVISLLTSCSTFVFGRTQNCTLNLFKAGKRHNPLILKHNQLTNKYDFVIPEDGIVKLHTGENITVACTGSGNSLTNSTNLHFTHAICVNNKILNVNGSSKSFDKIQCKKHVKSNIMHSNTSCGNNEGKLIDIGFSVNNEFITLINVCYNEDRGNTLYTKHFLHGRTIRHANKRVTHRPSFSSLGLGYRHADKMYTIKNEKLIFNKLLGSVGNTYINSHQLYLAKGHVSPSHDFIYDIFQDASFYYLNTCPQWQSINNGNWKTVEHKIRNAAKIKYDTFSIITGTHGILSLRNDKDQLSEVFLSEDKIVPIPKYIWKIIYNEESKQGIAIIILNNPYANESQNTMLCQNICSQYGWEDTRWNTGSKGYVHCCDLTSFANIVPTAPQYQVKGILRY